MGSQNYPRAGAVALAIIASLAGAPAAPATAPSPGAGAGAAGGGASGNSIRIETATRTHFEDGEPIGDFINALAVRFGVMVIQPESVNLYVLRTFDLPPKVGDALAVARQNLEPQGYSLVQKISDGRLVVRIVQTAEAKKILQSETPLSFGTQGEAIDISDPTRLVTHLFPLNHADMADALRRNASQDPDVSAEITGGGGTGTNLILRGPALKVQRAVETLAKLDKPTEGPIVARTLTLQHMDAQGTADALNEVFARGTSPLKAVADRRTNSIVVTGPEERVMEVMVGLVSQEAKQGRVLAPPSRSGPPAPIPPLPPTLPTPLPAPPDTAPAGGPGALRTTPPDRMLARWGGLNRAGGVTPSKAAMALRGPAEPGGAPWVESPPTAVRKRVAQGLDEIAADGDNGGPTPGPGASTARFRFSSIVNMDVIL